MITLRPKWRLWVVGCLLQISVNQGIAATQGDWDVCTSQEPGKNIPACTRIIDDSSTSDVDRVDAYLWRASHNVAQNSIDPAIKDYSSAIKLNPRNITALSGRAIAYFRKGNRDDAAIDYSIAKRFDQTQLDSMVAKNDELKEIAKAVSQSPVPAAQLDAAIDRLIPVTLSCPVGYRLQGSTCLAISCPIGERLNGNNCTAIVCGPGEELSGNDCVASAKYVALALGQTNRLAFGTSWGQATLEDATDNALQNCRSRLPQGRCKIILSGQNVCLALSWTPVGTGWGAARRETREEAVSASLDSCRSANRRKNCVVVGSWCSL
jgi:hypothetical protein